MPDRMKPHQFAHKMTKLSPKLTYVQRNLFDREIAAVLLAAQCGALLDPASSNLQDMTAAVVAPLVVVETPVDEQKYEQKASSSSSSAAETPDARRTLAEAFTEFRKDRRSTSSTRSASSKRSAISTLHNLPVSPMPLQGFAKAGSSVAAKDAARAHTARANAQALLRGNLAPERWWTPLMAQYASTDDPTKAEDTDLAALRAPIYKMLEQAAQDITGLSTTIRAGDVAALIECVRTAITPPEPSYQLILGVRQQLAAAVKTRHLSVMEVWNLHFALWQEYAAINTVPIDGLEAANGFRTAVQHDGPWTQLAMLAGREMDVQQLLHHFQQLEQYTPALQATQRRANSAIAGDGTDTSVPPYTQFCYNCAHPDGNRACDANKRARLHFLTHITRSEYEARHPPSDDTCYKCKAIGHHGNICPNGARGPGESSSAHQRRKANQAAKAAAKRAAKAEAKLKAQAAALAAATNAQTPAPKLSSIEIASLRSLLDACEQENKASDSESTVIFKALAARLATPSPASSGASEVVFLADSGCNHTLIRKSLRKILNHGRPSSSTVDTATAGDAGALQCESDGKLTLQIGTKTTDLEASTANAADNLLAVSALDQAGIVSCFGNNAIHLFGRDPKGRTIFPGIDGAYTRFYRAQAENGLYPVRSTALPAPATISPLFAKLSRGRAISKSSAKRFVASLLQRRARGDLSPYQLIHRNLGHQHLDPAGPIFAICRQLYGKSFKPEPEALCSTCQKTKLEATPHIARKNHPARPGLEIAMDAFYMHLRWYLAMADMFDGHKWVLPLGAGATLANSLPDKLADIERENGHATQGVYDMTRLEGLRSDQLPAHTSGALVDCLKQRNIEQRFSATYTPEQNGVAEAAVYRLKQGGSANLEQSGLPVTFFEYALQYFVYTYNHTPRLIHANDGFLSTAQRRGLQKPADWGKELTSALLPFGAQVFVKIPKDDTKRKHLGIHAGVKAVEAAFLGYGQGNNIIALTVDKQILLDGYHSFSVHADVFPFNKAHRPVASPIGPVAPDTTVVPDPTPAAGVRPKPKPATAAVSPASADSPVSEDDPPPVAPTPIPLGRAPAHGPFVAYYEYDSWQVGEITEAHPPGKYPNPIIAFHPLTGPASTTKRGRRKKTSGFDIPWEAGLTGDFDDDGNFVYDDPQWNMPLYAFRVEVRGGQMHVIQDRCQLVAEAVDAGIIPSIGHAKKSAPDRLDEHKTEMERRLEARNMRKSKAMRACVARVVANSRRDRVVVYDQTAKVRKAAMRLVRRIKKTWNPVAFNLDPEYCLRHPPKSTAEADARPDADIWAAARQIHMDKMKDYNVFTVTAMAAAEIKAENINPLQVIWVYSYKHPQGELGRDEPTNAANLIPRARIAAQGFRQREGQDYLHTYSPCMRAPTFLTLEALRIRHSWASGTGDVSCAFFLSRQQVLQYMVPPVGPQWDAAGNRILFRCERTIPGQKDGSRNWWDTLSSALRGLGYDQCPVDPCLFRRGNHKDGSFTSICTHVDDLAGFADTDERLAAAFNEIRGIFPFDWTLKIKSFMGIDSETLPCGGTAYYQPDLVDAIIHDYEELIGADVQLQTKPLPKGCHFTVGDIVRDPETRTALADLPYSKALGQLGYVANHTRPDLSHAVSLLQGFLLTYGPKHVLALEHLIGYLKQTRMAKLNFKVDGTFMAYAASDASWASDQIDRRSRSGIVVFVYGMAVYWSSKKQTAVTLSSMEGETVAFTDACKEVIWLRRILEFLGRDTSDPTPILTDNAATESFTTTGQVTSRTKHISLKHFFNKENIAKGEVAPVHTSTNDELADLLTKAPGPLFQKFKDQLLGEVPKENLNKCLNNWLHKFTRQQQLLSSQAA